MQSPPPADQAEAAEKSRLPRPSRRTAVTAAAVAVLVLTAIVFYRWGAAGQPTARPTTTPRPSPTQKAPTTAEIFQTVAPSVVLIQAGNSTGTGVVANADGVILTALHVVKGADAIRVTYADGTRSPAKVIGSDPTQDIAALTTEQLPQVLVPAVLGSSGRLAVGDGVVAIGNPLGLTLSTTTGVVSGLQRDVTGMDGVELHGLIQFDAAVNPGSSGGPLLNSRGETVGIVVALANPTAAGTFIGIGFAVPIATAVAGGGPAPQQ